MALTNTIQQGYRDIIYVKAETTEGTGEVCAAGDLLPHTSFSMSVDQQPIDLVTKSTSPAQLYREYGQESVTWELTGYYQPSGTAGTASDWDVIFQTIWTGTNTPATSEVYTPCVGNSDTFQIHRFLEGLEIHLIRCVATSVEFSTENDVLMAKVSGVAEKAIFTGKSELSGDEAAAQTTLSVTNPTAANLDHVGKFIFIEDTGTLAQCEIAYITECGADA